jgi:HEAT repeat protein
LPAGADEIARAIHDLGSESVALRIEAARRLAKMTPDDGHRAEVLKALQKSLQDENIFVRTDAVKGLGVWGKEDIVPVLLDQIKSREPLQRKAAVEALGHFRTEKVAEALAGTLGDIHVQHEAEVALKAMGSLGEQALLKQLEQASAQTRSAACRVLGRIGTKASIPALQALAVSGEFAVQAQAKQALRAIQQRERGR